MRHSAEAEAGYGGADMLAWLVHERDLTATLFAGSYTLPKSMGGGTYAFALGVPGPEVGVGISFAIAGVLALAGYALFQRKKVAKQS